MPCMTARRPLALSEPAVICKTGHSVAVRLQRDALCENVSESGHHTGTGRTGISLCHTPCLQGALGSVCCRLQTKAEVAQIHSTGAQVDVGSWPGVAESLPAVVGPQAPPTVEVMGRSRTPPGGHSLWKAGRPGAQALAPFGSGSGRDVAPGAVSEGGCVWRGREHGFALESAGWGLSTGASSWGRGGCGIPGQHTRSPGAP